MPWLEDRVTPNHASSNQRNGIIILFMGNEAIELLRKALSLPPAQRAELAGSLIESLDERQDESVQAAWDKELIRRMEDFDAGRMRPVSLEDFKKRLYSFADGDRFCGAGVPPAVFSPGQLSAKPPARRQRHETSLSKGARGQRFDSPRGRKKP